MDKKSNVEKKAKIGIGTHAYTPHTHIHVYKNKHHSLLYTHTPHTNIHTNTHTNAHIHIHTQMHTYMHTQTHTHTYQYHKWHYRDSPHYFFESITLLDRSSDAWNPVIRVGVWIIY